MKMIGSQMIAQFSMASKLKKPPPSAGGAICSTLKLSLPFSRMKSLRPASTSQPSGTAAPGLAAKPRSVCTARPQLRSPVSITVTL